MLVNWFLVALVIALFAYDLWLHRYLNRVLGLMNEIRELVEKKDKDLPEGLQVLDTLVTEASQNLLRALRSRPPRG